MNSKKGDEGTHKYTVEEVAGTDATVTYDTMKAEISVWSFLMELPDPCNEK